MFVSSKISNYLVKLEIVDTIPLQQHRVRCEQEQITKSSPNCEKSFELIALKKASHEYIYKLYCTALLIYTLIFADKHKQQRVHIMRCLLYSYNNATFTYILVGANK